ncbi:GNAT family N-acetyltransferase [Longispora albida]|uniref:GNAT family N-acetyltransferase n=1 Tax=Longispora albida TaxID=203523 RepID=UPI0003637A78|nr:GNAT family N-acetyltransferase [Longispora albida]
MEIMIRQITAADTAKARALRIEALADAPLAFGTRLDEACARPNEFWAEQTANGAAGTSQAQFVAVDGEALVGSVIGLDQGDHTFVIGVYVRPGYRGKGLLGGLMAAVGDWSPHAELRLEVTSPAALRAYQKIGFAENGKLDYFVPKGTTIRREMTKVV